MTPNKTTAISLAIASALVLGTTPVHANTFYGTGAGTGNTGSDNTAFGDYSLSNSSSGSNNTASGSSSLFDNTTGSNNTANGYSALSYNATGSQNTASGSGSLYFNSSGNFNTAAGYGSLYYNTTGYNNTAGGAYSLYQNTTGRENTASGYHSLFSNTTGIKNTANGEFSLNANTAGVLNTASGYQSLTSNTTGHYNAASGAASLAFNTTGSFNTAIGYAAGYKNAIGAYNVFLGRQAGYNELGSNKLYISNNATTPLLYGVFSPTASANKLGVGTIAVPAGDAIRVWNGAHLTTGGVWTNASSRDLKDHIQSLSAEDADKALNALSPVRYVYKNSPDEEYVGFIAEDVPGLVAMNDHKSLSPMDIVAVLTTVTKEQKIKMTEKDGEIAALRDSLAQQEQRMQRMEMALAQLQTHP